MRRGSLFLRQGKLNRTEKAFSHEEHNFVEFFGKELPI